MTHDAYIHRESSGTPGNPIVFTFHGTGGNENQFFEFGQTLIPGAAVVSPRGDVSEHGAARFFRRTGEGVYDLADLGRATEKMSQFVAAHRERHGASKIIGLGYSNGANILANVMIEYPDLFDAGILMHPLIPFAPKARSVVRPAQVLITAGRHDPICPAPMTQRLAGYFEGRGDEVALEWHDGGHEIRSNEIEAAQSFAAGIKSQARFA